MRICLALDIAAARPVEGVLLRLRGGVVESGELRRLLLRLLDRGLCGLLLGCLPCRQRGLVLALRLRAAASRELRVVRLLRLNPLGGDVATAARGLRLGVLPRRKVGSAYGLRLLTLGLLLFGLAFLAKRVRLEQVDPERGSELREVLGRPLLLLGDGVRVVQLLDPLALLGRAGEL